MTDTKPTNQLRDVLFWIILRKYGGPQANDVTWRGTAAELAPLLTRLRVADAPKDPRILGRWLRQLVDAGECPHTAVRFKRRAKTGARIIEITALPGRTVVGQHSHG